MFDLPVLTKRQRKAATQFRDGLLDDGYMMIQFSVYARACSDLERMEKHKKRLKSFAPAAGNIRLLFLTDRQWTQGETICGPDFSQGSRQLELHLPEQSEFWT